MGIDNIFDNEDVSLDSGQVIIVNKYENPQQSLDLIAHICTAKVDVDVSSQWSVFDKISGDIEDCAQEHGLITRLGQIVKDEISEIVSDIEDGGTKLKIAVGGGYSAGKSSFLNAITGAGPMLPTGIDPVSIVNTYLNCNSGLQRIIIRGKNLRGGSVLLNEDVLASIQHSSKSKVYIASVLNKLVIDIPVKDFLDNITFIDTPGYNNSLNKNQENDTTDKTTAQKAISEADALFWCIDIDAGTVSHNDFEMLRSAGDKPVVIFFTKMDKKPESEVDIILKTAWELCGKVLGKDHLPMDIVGVISNTEVPKFRSSTGLSFQNIIEFIKKDVGKKDIAEYYRQKLIKIFYSEIEAIEKDVAELEEERLRIVKEKDDVHKFLMDNKKYVNDTIQECRELILDDYDNLVTYCDDFSNSCSEAIEWWSDTLDRESEWQGKAGFFSDTSSLVAKNNKSIESYNNIVNKFNKQLNEFQYYKREYRENFLTRLSDEISDNVKRYESYQKTVEEDYSRIIKNKKALQDFKYHLMDFRDDAVRQYDNLFGESLSYMERHNSRLQSLKEDKDIDIFSSIRRNRYEDFLSCFSKGVDMSVRDADGYSPFTLAVKFGNNEMVNYFLIHGANPATPDKRGYNAFETAVIFHYQDICELLLKHDGSLIHTPHNIDSLLSENTFNNWIHNI